MKYKLPRLNTYVYIITYVNGSPSAITRDKVYMKNKKSFITEEMLSDYLIPEFPRPLDAYDYGRHWCKSLKECKEILEKWRQEELEYFGNEIEPYKLKKVDENSWNVI